MDNKNQRITALSSPYFSGQKPCECGHYYPDVLRLRDEKRSDGVFVRLFDCRYCGRFELPLDEHTLNDQRLHNLNTKGYDTGIRDEEVAQFREKELKRLLSEDESTTTQETGFEQKPHAPTIRDYGPYRPYQPPPDSFFQAIGCALLPVLGCLTLLAIMCIIGFIGSKLSHLF